MRDAVVHPAKVLGRRATVDGDKSIAHRWLILAATADGESRIRGVPGAIDVTNTAQCLAMLTRSDETAESLGVLMKTWRGFLEPKAIPGGAGGLRLTGTGFTGLRRTAPKLWCGNSATTMRLLAGVLARIPAENTLTGDESLRRRPMDRVAEPLIEMGARVETTDGHAPIVVEGPQDRPLKGIHYSVPVPSAQVKSAVLLAGLGAEGETVVAEGVATRDHTERVLAALGAPIQADGGDVTLGGEFQHEGLDGDIPGDISSAAFLIAAALVTGSKLTVEGVGLNPSRLKVLDVLKRMGADIDFHKEAESLDEPSGEVEVAPADLEGVTVSPEELPLLIDEVPALAMVAAFASSESRFEGAGELRVKESDRLAGLAAGIQELGGQAAVEGDALIIGGGGLQGGTAHSDADHRLAMALTVGALGAKRPSQVTDMTSAEISFPGFVQTMLSLGAEIELK